MADQEADMKQQFLTHYTMNYWLWNAAHFSSVSPSCSIAFNKFTVLTCFMSGYFTLYLVKQDEEGGESRIQDGHLSIANSRAWQHGIRMNKGNDEWFSVIIFWCGVTMKLRNVEWRIIKLDYNVDSKMAAETGRFKVECKEWQSKSRSVKTIVYFNAYAS